MQRFSPEIPWVLVAHHAGTGSYAAACQVCRAQIDGLGQAQIAQFAQTHRVHQAPAGSMRLGDAVAAIAKPIAKAVGMDPNCTPCEARRRMLNQLGRHR